MHKLFRNFTFYTVILVSIGSNAACDSANVKADVLEPSGAATSAATENVAVNQPKQTKRSAPMTVTAASLAGNYEYNSVKKGEGYVNSLAVENKGAGKLSVAFVADYVYKANGAQTFHETEGAGDGRLTGNTAIANVADEEDKNCPVRIVFTGNQATVNVPAHCHFNVALDGVYKKEKSKAVENQSDKSELSEVAFENLADLINDSDNHPAGERFVVKGVPLAKIEGVWRADLNGNRRLKGLFSMDFENGGADGSGAFLASAELVRNVQANGSSKTASVRVTATLVETGGEISRAAFVTKVEGLDDNDELLWAARGDAPSKVKF